MQMNAEPANNSLQSLFSIIYELILVGEWRRNGRSGFGAYHYRNGDVYEGSWRHDQRHGLGTYTYAAGGSRYYGTWIADRMQGVGQLIHQRHRFHGFWENNLVALFYSLSRPHAYSVLWLFYLYNTFIIVHQYTFVGRSNQ